MISRGSCQVFDGGGGPKDTLLDSLDSIDLLASMKDKLKKRIWVWGDHLMSHFRQIIHVISMPKIR